MESSDRRLGNCACAFWMAVAFDIFGMLILLTGVFANVFFYDFLIYAGAIIIFLSLIWWVFWYTGNIEVPPEELEDDIGLPPKKPNEGITGTVRSLSRRLSHGILHSLRNRAPRASPRDPPAPGTRAFPRDPPATGTRAFPRDPPAPGTRAFPRDPRDPPAPGTRAFPRDPPAPGTRPPRGDTHTISEFVEFEFDIRTSEAFPNV